MGFIERIKKKPYKDRVRIVWILLGISFVGLILLWVFTSRIGENTKDGIEFIDSINNEVKDARDYWKAITPPPAPPTQPLN